MFTIPACQSAGILYYAQMLELSRVRMIVFSEHNLPVDQCMALIFHSMKVRLYPRLWS